MSVHAEPADSPVVEPETTIGVLDAAAPLIQPRDIAAHLSALEAGGVSTVLATISSIEDARFTFAVLAEWLELERKGDIPFRIARTVADIDQAVQTGKLAAVLHLQGGDPIEADVNLVNAYHALGVRVIQLTYNFGNRMGDGCLERRDGGLTKFGRAVIARMNELGVVVDVAHGGVRMSLEAVNVSSAPVIVSHANARAIHDSRRNLTDEQIDAIAASGGVIGVCAFPGFVAADEPNLERLLDHIDYLVERVGDDHVGFGFDFSQETAEDYDYYGYEEDTYPRPPWVYPAGIAGFADEANVSAGLSRRGYSDEQIERIGRGNFLRVFGEVWAR